MLLERDGARAPASCQPVACGLLIFCRKESRLLKLGHETGRAWFKRSSRSAEARGAARLQRHYGEEVSQEELLCAHWRVRGKGPWDQLPLPVASLVARIP